MGKAIGSIGSAIGGIIKQVAPSVIKAVAPAATALLSKITDGFVSKGADFLKTALGKLNLPSPINSLLGKLIGKGAEKLKELGGGLLEKGLAKLTEMVTKRFAPGAGNISLPSQGSAERVQAQVANSPSAPSTGSSSSAATANTSGGGISGGPTGSSSAPNTPPDMPTNWEDRAQVEKYQRGMQAFQAAMQGMQAYFTMMSNIIKSQGDTAKQVIGNLR